MRSIVLGEEKLCFTLNRVKLMTATSKGSYTWKINFQTPDLLFVCACLKGFFIETNLQKTLKTMKQFQEISITIYNCFRFFSKSMPMKKALIKYFTSIMQCNSILKTKCLNLSHFNQYTFHFVWTSNLRAWWQHLILWGCRILQWLLK